MYNLRAIATLVILLVSSIVMQMVLGIPCLLFVYPLNRFDRRLYGYTSRTIGKVCQAYWVQMVAFLFPETKLVITGELPKDNGPKIVLVNHQVDVDWWFAWTLSLITGPWDSGLVKIMLKDSLKYIPILGWGCWFFGFIFIKRNWQQDSKSLTRVLNECVEDGIPIWILMFPEGTTIHTEAVEAANKFAKTSTPPRPQFKRVLLPREKGFSACLKAFKDCKPTIYDLTMGYPSYSGEVPTHSMGYHRNKDKDIPHGQGLLGGKGPSAVHINIEKIPFDSVSEDRTKWLDGQWQKKEVLLEGFAKTGKFPGKSTSHVAKGSLVGVTLFLAFLMVEIWLLWAVGLL